LAGVKTDVQPLFTWKKYGMLETMQLCRMSQMWNVVKDKQHIIKCSQDQVTTKWNAAIADLTKWMKEENSAPH